MSTETKPETPTAEATPQQFEKELVVIGQYSMFTCKDCTDRLADPLLHSIQSGHTAGYVVTIIPVEAERLKTEVEAEQKAVEEPKTTKSKKQLKA